MGRLAPNERVMNLSMIVQISTSGCYLIPLHIAKSMAPCGHLFHSSKLDGHRTRLKRYPFGWIMGGGALVVGAINTVAITDLRGQIQDYAERLRGLQSKVETSSATLISVRDGTILIAKELKATQESLTDHGKAIVQLENNDNVLNESIAFLANSPREFSPLSISHRNVRRSSKSSLPYSIGFNLCHCKNVRRSPIKLHYVVRSLTYYKSNSNASGMSINFVSSEYNLPCN